MAGHHHSSGRQAPIGWQPASIKELDHLTCVGCGYPRYGWMSQHPLDLLMLQEVRASSPCHQIPPCQHELGYHGCVAIVSIKTDQRHFYWESKVLQRGSDGMPR
jgi:hypothetical protein